MAIKIILSAGVAGRNKAILMDQNDLIRNSAETPNVLDSRAGELLRLLQERDHDHGAFLAAQILASSVALRDRLADTQPDSLKRLMPILHARGWGDAEVREAVEELQRAGVVDVRTNAYFELEVTLRE